MTSVSSSLGTIGVIAVAMAIVAASETLLPLHARGRWNRAHLGPNLALTAMTFATNAVFNADLVVLLAALQPSGFGLLRVCALPSAVGGVAALIALDLTTYLAHASMHRSRLLWRFHRVHHSDPAVDVTTTIRQHPGEGVIRYAFIAAAAVALGASPGAFAVYRAWSAITGLLEHANLGLPRRLDTLLAMVVVTPNMHKVHHSRRASETNSNYGNLFSVFDRLFATFTPSARGAQIVYGLDGWDDPASQTTAALLAVPFRDARTARAATALAKPRSA